MTNNEFWLSIREIIDNGFSDEGLTKLDEYAEQFISGRLVYKRFSPAEQHGCDEGGTNHVIASILAGAEVGSDKCTAPIGSFKREQQCGAVQERRILASEPTSATPFVHQSRNTYSQKKLILRLAGRLGRLTCRRSLGAFL